MIQFMVLVLITYPKKNRPINTLLFIKGIKVLNGGKKYLRLIWK